jgi:hypothetical protein
LSRVSRKRFDVAALAFGIERIERQAGFAGAGDAAHDRDGVMRNHKINVLKVMYARPAHTYLLNIPREGNYRRRASRRTGSRAVGCSRATRCRRAAGRAPAARNSLRFRSVTRQLLYRFRSHMCKPKIIRPTVNPSKSPFAVALSAQTLDVPLQAMLRFRL